MLSMRFFWRLCVVAVVVALASIFSVATPQATGPIVDADWPVVAAHRGGATAWPQNTMLAFDNATTVRPGVALEFDVKALKDGTLVIFHDTKVDSLSANSMTGAVNSLTLAQWRTLRVKSPTGGASAPAATLDDVLSKYGNGDTLLVPEVKDTAALNAFIDKLHPYREQVLVQSFDAAIVSRLVRSGFKTLQLVDNSSVTLVDGIHSVGVQTLSITPALVAQAHSRGVKVWAWGDQVTTAQYESHDRGLDGYMVNDPTS